MKTMELEIFVAPMVSTICVYIVRATLYSNKMHHWPTFKVAYFFSSSPVYDLCYGYDT